MEKTNPPKKLWNIVRIVVFMIRKRISIHKLISHINHLMTEHGKTAMENLSCKPSDAHLSFISPREYEFSCSNSPAFPFHLSSMSKRKHHHHRYYNKRHHYQSDDIITVSAVQKALEMLNNSEVMEAALPLVVSGYGRSPLMVRQLRVTDSPFPVRNSDEDRHVDKEAGEFIERFYDELRLQNRMAAVDSWNRNMPVRNYG